MKRTAQVTQNQRNVKINILADKVHKQWVCNAVHCNYVNHIDAESITENSFSAFTTTIFSDGGGGGEMPACQCVK